MTSEILGDVENHDLHCPVQDPQQKPNPMNPSPPAKGGDLVQ